MRASWKRRFQLSGALRHLPFAGALDRLVLAGALHRLYPAPVMRPIIFVAALVITSLSFPGTPNADQAPAPQAAGAKAPVHAKQARRLLIQHAMVISGNGTPASGPLDILIEDGVISRIGAADRTWAEA